jgi:hypothetical protein
MVIMDNLTSIAANNLEAFIGNLLMATSNPFIGAM